MTGLLEFITERLADHPIVTVVAVLLALVLLAIGILRQFEQLRLDRLNRKMRELDLKERVRKIILDPSVALPTALVLLLSIGMVGVFEQRLSPPALVPDSLVDGTTPNFPQPGDPFPVGDPPPPDDPPDPPPPVVTQCETFNTTDYNADGSCFDAQPRPMAVPLVPLPPEIPDPPSPATLAIKVNMDGTVALVLLITPSDNAAFTQAALVYAGSIEYNPAQRNGQAVVGWIQQVFFPGRRQ